MTSHLMEMVALAFLTFEDGRGGVANVLLITDILSKYAMAVASANQTARTTARTFFDAFVIQCHGFPPRIYSDQRRNLQKQVHQGTVQYCWNQEEPHISLPCNGKWLHRTF